MKQLFQDCVDGRVPGVGKVCDMMRCGLAMKRDKPYVRDSADALVFEELDPFDTEDSSIDDSDLVEPSEFNPISSFPAEFKCRSGAGRDGSLQQAERIQKKIADRIGGSARVDMATGKALYLQVSSSDKDLDELIPTASEKVQILHHAYTYGRKKTIFAVGNHRGEILYGLVVNFDNNLLEGYGEALDFLYENGLNVFYKDSVAPVNELPLELIEGILSSTPKLKSKYVLDDFITSFLIWRAFLPGGQHIFPIPAIKMLLPLEHSIWNSSKGGSDTVSKHAWSCLAVLSIKMPQCSVVARFFLNYAVIFHRVRQVIHMRKRVNIATDTIQTVRNRNNKRFSFHQSINKIHQLLLRSNKKEENSSTGNEAAGTALQQPAKRYNGNNANKRVRVDHTILERAGKTGATPGGRGHVKSSLENNDSYDAYHERLLSCRGCAMRTCTLPDKKRKVHRCW